MQWCLIYCSGACTFQAFTPPDEDTGLFYPCDLERDLINTCPPSYSDWRLSELCVIAATSFLYTDTHIFRNAYCAICHLGDSISSADIWPPRRLSSTDLTNGIPKLEPSVDLSSSIRFSYGSMQCCRHCHGQSTDYCSHIGNTNNLWGQINDPSKEGCLPFPSNLTCDANAFGPPIWSQSNLRFEFLCPEVNISCNQVFAMGCPWCGNLAFGRSAGSFADGNNDFAGIIISNKNENDGDSAPGVLESIFSWNSVIETNKRVEATAHLLITPNESLQFCSGGVIRGILTDSNYSKIVLSRSKIKVSLSEINAFWVSYSSYHLIHDCLSVKIHTTYN